MALERRGGIEQAADVAVVAVPIGTDGVDQPQPRDDGRGAAAEPGLHGDAAAHRDLERGEPDAAAPRFVEHRLLDDVLAGRRAAVVGSLVEDEPEAGAVVAGADHLELEIDLQREAERIEAGAQVRGGAGDAEAEPTRAIDERHRDRHHSTIGRHTGRSTWKSSGAISSMARSTSSRRAGSSVTTKGSESLGQPPSCSTASMFRSWREQRVGERRDDARLVAHDEAQVVRVDAARLDARRPIVGDLEPPGRRRVPRDRQDVGEYGDRRRLAAGAAAEEAGLAAALADRQDQVLRSADARSTEPFLTSAGSTAASTDRRPSPFGLCRSTRDTCRMV